VEEKRWREWREENKEGGALWSPKVGRENKGTKKREESSAFEGMGPIHFLVRARARYALRQISGI
jgi:hypothetical protein